MSWRIEQNGENRDIVIDGWENGIASTPYGGISMLKNVNTMSIPGEVSVHTKLATLNKPPAVSELAFTVAISTDVFTVSDTTNWYNGMAIELDTVVTSTGISTGRVYWVGDLSGNTFKLYKNPARDVAQLVDVTGSDGSGTLSSYTIGKPIDYATAYEATNTVGENHHHIYILDDVGLVWWIDNKNGTVTDNLVYLGNDDNSASPQDLAINVWKSHIIVSRSASGGQSYMDALSIQRVEGELDMDASYPSGWEYQFENISSNRRITSRPTFVGQDDILYFANGGRIGSLSENSGSDFNPTDGGTYTKNIEALDLPNDEEVVSIGSLGTSLLIGGIKNKIYPWDRISSSFNVALEISEDLVTHIVSTNNASYVFAGTRGRIYSTNGSFIDEFIKIPDHITEKPNPYFTIDAVELDRNQIYFSLTATENDGTAVSGLDGIWALDINTESIRLEQQASHGTDGTVSLIARNPLSPTQTSPGAGVIVGWEDDSSNYGVDKGSSNPYSGGESIIETDIIPIGTHTEKETPSHIEFKLSRPLVSGESIELQQRGYFGDSYTTIGNNTTVGAISGTFDTNFENSEWIQMKVILTSTDTTPSRVPLRELRIRL